MNKAERQVNRATGKSRRLVLKRLAILGAVAVAPAILGASGCQTMKDLFHKDQPRTSKTIDDVLSEERPSW